MKSNLLQATFAPLNSLNTLLKRILAGATILIFLSVTGWAQSIFDNPITGTNPNTANPYTTGQTVNGNITVSGIGRGTGITGSSANDRYNATSWNTSGLDANDYFQWILTPNAGQQINFVSFVYTGQASGTGPTSFALRSSADGFVADIGTPTATGTTISLSAATYQNVTTPITFRLYAWGGTGGTYSVNSFTFNGTVVASCTAPTATVSGSATICNGSSTTIQAALTGTGPWNVTWSDGNTQTGVAASPATRSVSPTSTTTYTVTAVSDSTGCTPGTFSGSAVVTVTQPVTPSVSVSANPGTTTCASQNVIFTATPVNGGGSPTYVWKTNGVVVTGVTGNTFTAPAGTLSNGETIDCQLTSSLTCVTTATADATQLTMTITASTTPSVSVGASPGTTICSGVSVTFTATPVNGGGSPTYVWKTNGVVVTGVTGATYTTSTLANGDTIDCQLTSTDPCASPTTADATQITMTVNPLLTPSVTIAADPGSTICSNSSVTFTATPVNGGTTPTYQWKTNAVSVTGATASTFTTSILKNGDVVTVVMTPSSEVCLAAPNATSSGITMTVNPVPISTITAASSVVQNATGNAASVPDAGVGATYVWTISGGSITAGQGTLSITYTAGGTLGTLTLGCTVTFSTGCSSVGSRNTTVKAPVLAGWDVNPLPGGTGTDNFGPSPLAAGTTADNITVVGLTRGSGVSIPTSTTAAARAWGGLDWQSTSTATAVSANKFATFTIAGNTGYRVSYNAISRFDYRRSGTGAATGTVQYQAGSGDTFHDITTVSYTSTAGTGGSLSPIDLSGISALQNVPPGTVVTFRIANYGGTGSGGTWYVFDVANSTETDLEINGYVTPNTAPIANNATSNCTPGLSLAIQITGAGGLASDADGDTLSVTAGNPSQGTNMVFTVGADKYIYYQNTNAAATTDSFTYTVTDGFGGSATGTNFITISGPNSESQNKLSDPEPTGVGTDVRLKFLTIPGYAYALEWTHDLTPTITWTALATNTASANGLIIYTNTPSAGPDYYRTRWVP